MNDSDRSRAIPTSFIVELERLERDALRARVAELEKLLRAHVYDQHHGCTSGDCPHDHIGKCFDALVSLLRERSRDAERVLEIRPTTTTKEN